MNEVEVQDSKIVFTLKDDDRIYETAKMNDPQLIERLSDSGAKFTGEINESMSPMTSFLLTWVFANSAVHVARKPDAEESHEKSRWRSWVHDVRHGEIQCKGVRSVHQRN